MTPTRHRPGRSRHLTPEDRTKPQPGFPPGSRLPRRQRGSAADHPAGRPNRPGHGVQSNFPPPRSIKQPEYRALRQEAVQIDSFSPSPAVQSTAGTPGPLGRSVPGGGEKGTRGHGMKPAPPSSVQAGGRPEVGLAEPGLLHDRATALHDRSSRHALAFRTRDRVESYLDLPRIHIPIPTPELATRAASVPHHPHDPVGLVRRGPESAQSRPYHIRFSFHHINHSPNRFRGSRSRCPRRHRDPRWNSIRSLRKSPPSPS